MKRGKEETREERRQGGREKRRKERRKKGRRGRGKGERVKDMKTLGIFSEDRFSHPFF